MTPIETYDKATEIYLNNISRTKPSPLTFANYRKRISIFREFWLAAHNGTPDREPQVSDVLAWRDSMQDKGVKPITINQYMQELGIFFRAMSDDEAGDLKLFSYCPVSKRYFLKVEKEPLQDILGAEGIKKLFDPTPRKCARAALWWRNYAIINVMLATGLRCEETVDLNLNDVDFNYNEITVRHGKGNKTRIVDMPDIAVYALKLYLNSGYRPKDISGDEPLFGTFRDAQKEGTVWRRGSPLGFTNLICRHVEAVTGTPKVRAHDLRRLYSRINLNAGWSKERLQGQLGHSSVVTTEIYSGAERSRRWRDEAAEILAERDRQAARLKKMLEQTAQMDTSGNILESAR